jgi:hypothetical protein
MFSGLEQSDKKEDNSGLDWGSNYVDYGHQN